MWPAIHRTEQSDKAQKEKTSLVISNLKIYKCAIKWAEIAPMDGQRGPNKNTTPSTTLASILVSKQILNFREILLPSLLETYTEWCVEHIPVSLAPRDTSAIYPRFSHPPCRPSCCPLPDHWYANTKGKASLGSYFYLGSVGSGSEKSGLVVVRNLEVKSLHQREDV